MENRSTINIVVFISFQMLIPLEEKKEYKIGFFRNSEKLLALASGGHCYFPENFETYNKVSMLDAQTKQDVI